MKKFFTQFLFLFFITLPVFAQPPGWSYSQAFTITNNSATQGLNIQVPLIINTQALISAGQMQSNGNDIRFSKSCSGTSFYNYYIDTGLNTANTRIWVQIDTLYASAAKTIYMFYGNSSAAAASTLTTFNGPYSSTNQVTGGTAGGVGNSQRGFRFSPNVDILVAQFGKNEPTGTTRYVTLFDNSSQGIIRQMQVSGASGSYVYANLTSPVWLTAGTQYVLQLFQGTNDGYYYGNSSQINSNLTYYDMRYCNSCTQTTFPTSVLSNYHYGYPDFNFYTRNTLTPAPTYTLGSSGSGGSISSQPQNVTACPGSSTSFGITTNGTISSYQWQVNTGSGFTNLSNGSPYSGVNTNTLTINPVAAGMNTYQYRCQVLGGCGTVTSGAATLTVPSNAAPTITISAATTTICAGQADSFTVTGTTNGGATPLYQWRINGVNISGATNAIFTTTTLANGNTVTCVLTSSNACAVPLTATSNTITMTVNPIPVITAGNNGPICAGNTLNLTASTYAGASYNWTGPNSFTSTQQNPSIANATTAASGTYTVTAKALGCTSAPVTTNALVKPTPTATATVISGPTTICQGDTVKIQASTGGGYTYQWKNAGSPVAGATSSLYRALTSGTYTVTITNASNCTATSAPAIQVTVVPAPVSTISYTTPLIFCDGNSVLLKASTGSNLVYQWYRNGNPIAGATGTTYTATVSGTYTVKETNIANCSNTSTGVTVTVTQVLNPIITKDGNRLNTSGFVYYQWYFNNTPIPGANGATLDITQTGYYTVVATDVNGCISTSAIAWIQSLGIQGFVYAGDIKIYPNPARTLVHITAPAALKVQVRSMQGQVVWQGDVPGDIDVSSLAGGVYMISLTDKEGRAVYTERLVKID